jgi:choline dehydrogenase-like flavoprotein
VNKEYDVIVVGSGPGGAGIAREMSRKGRKVLLIEKGGYIKRVGSTLSVSLMSEGFGLTRSREKNWVVRVANCGGASNLAAGCAIPPPREVFDPVGVNLEAEAEDAREELWIGELPDELVGEANLRLMEAANELGYNWHKMENFIDVEKCVPDCPLCTLGCRRGAKWTARVYVEEAVDKGTELLLHTKVQQVLVEDGKAVGVIARNGLQDRLFHGKSVVLSASMGNAPILRRSGIDEAGRGFACDYAQFVGGISKHIKTLRANPMTVGTLEHYRSDGFIIMPMFHGLAGFAVELARTGPQHLRKLPNFWRLTGIMVKIKDELRGEIYEDEDFSKPVTANDRARLAKGVEIAKRILRRVGCRDDSLFVTNPLGSPPSASCRIGDVVDANLQTRIPGLFCCDSSVFPEALGLPGVWTIVSLGKRLSKHLEETLTRG